MYRRVSEQKPYICSCKNSALFRIMLTRNKIKYLKELKEKKFRKEHGHFIAEGIKIVDEMIKGKFPVTTICATKDWLNKNSDILPTSIEVIEVSEDELKKISSFTTPQFVLAVASIPEKRFELTELKDQLALVLDNVKDPGNIGTIIRIADWFGIKNIICSPSSVELYNPKVIQATMGSFLRVNIYYEDLTSFLTTYHNSFPTRKIYAAVMDGESIYSNTPEEKGLLVMGSESHGISKEVISLCTDKVLIPSHSSVFETTNDSPAESLNVAVATAILCSEFKRNLLKA